MRTIHTEIGILAPADIVWRVLTDFSGWARWNPVLRVSGDATPGAKLDVQISIPGRKPVKIGSRIVRLDEGRLVLALLIDIDAFQNAFEHALCSEPRCAVDGDVETGEVDLLRHLRGLQGGDLQEGVSWRSMSLKVYAFRDAKSIVNTRLISLNYLRISGSSVILST